MRIEQGDGVVAINEEAEMAHLYRTYHRFLLDHAREMVGSDDAHDVVHSAIAKTLERREAFQKLTGMRAKRGALYRAVIDCAIDFLRHEAATSRMLARITGPRAAVKRWMAAHRRQEDAEIRAEVTRALDTLPKAWRHVFVLVRRHEMSNEEAARVLGVDVNTIRAHNCKANRKMRTSLSAVGVTPPRTSDGRASR